MSEFGVGRPPRPWNFYYPNSPEPGESSPPRAAEDHRQGGHWKDFGASSMNAISFGFVATAILISMFLIMAILEHLFRPNLSSSSQDGVTGSLEQGTSDNKSTNHGMQIMTTYAKDISVVMPGQKYPTCIAQPAPLVSCPRQGFRWPSQHHSLAFS